MRAKRASPWHDFAWQLGLRAVWLALLGIALGTVIIDWGAFGPVVAARDAILNEHMRQQAYARAPNPSDLSMVLVTMDAPLCNTLADPSLCARTPLVDRGRLAELVLNASIAGAKVLAIDFVPAARETLCDKATRALLAAISNATEHTIVVLPRPLAGSEPVFEEQPSFMDQCPAVRMGRPENLFFGHAFLGEIEHSDGLVGAIRPWIVADVAGQRGCRSTPLA